MTPTLTRLILSAFVSVLGAVIISGLVVNVLILLCSKNVEVAA